MRPRAPRCPTSGAYLDGRYGHVGHYVEEIGAATSIAIHDI
jgi:hypothetical protein